MKFAFTLVLIRFLCFFGSITGAREREMDAKTLISFLKGINWQSQCFRIGSNPVSLVPESKKLNK